MSELGVIAALGLVAAGGFAYLRRQRARAASLWAWSWASLYGAALLSTQAGSGTLLWLLGDVLSTLFLGLLLAGALAFRSRPLPGWLAPATAIATLVRVLATLSVGPTLSFRLGIPISVLFVGAATWLVARREEAGGHLAERLLAPAFLAVGVASVLDLHARASGGDTQAAVTFFSVVGLTTGLFQILALTERARSRDRALLSQREAAAGEARRQARALSLLRDVSEAGVAHQESGALAPALLSIVHDGLDLDASGIWLEPEPGGAGELRRAAHLGCDRPPDLDASHPLVARSLAAKEPLFLDEAPEAPPPGLETLAGEVLALLPLRSQGRPFGLLGAALRGARCFDAFERSLLASVADQVTLALHHVRRGEERRRQADLLAQERRVLRAVVDTAPVGIALIDRDRRIAMINRLCAEHFGLGEPEDSIGRRALDVIGQVVSRLEDPDEVLVRIRDGMGAPPEVEPEVRSLQDFAWTTPEPRMDGMLMKLASPETRSLVTFSSPVRADDGETLGRVWVTRDVTDERELELQLRQSQKMETVGRLAGGIAHDFNNQLTVILGNAALALDRLDPDSPAREPLGSATEAAEHCAQLTRRLLAFGRASKPRRERVDAAVALRDLARLLGPILGSNVDLCVEAEEEVPAIWVDPTQLQQILMNLAVNARDALDEDGGRITLALRRRDVGPAAVPAVPGSRPGRFVEFRVSDDGRGMDPATRERIFDPFFTTKPVGEGSGLGLSVVYGLVSAHDGWIEVETARGSGSIFRVALPVA